MTANNSRLAFDLLKTFTRRRALQFDDKGGETLTGSNGVLERWMEYCRDVYSFEMNLAYMEKNERSDPQGRGASGCAFTAT